MEESKKLKLPRYNILILVIALKVILLLIAVLIWGFKGFSILLLFLFFITGIYSFRTKNSGYILVALCMLVVMFIVITQNSSSQFIKLINMILGVSNLALMLYLVFSRKMKWRFRETFELAAKSVNETEDGFTSRPFPAGKKKCSKGDIRNFSKYLLKHLITVPYFEKERAVLVLSGNVYLRMLWLKNDYAEDTWVAFDYNGDVTVNITQKTYAWYKEELTFDQLCSSLGDLFVEFLEFYKLGEGDRVISRMNALKENVWTEL